MIYNKYSIYMICMMKSQQNVSDKIQVERSSRDHLSRQRNLHVMDFKNFIYTGAKAKARFGFKLYDTIYDIIKFKFKTGLASMEL